MRLLCRGMHDVLQLFLCWQHLLSGNYVTLAKITLRAMDRVRALQVSTLALADRSINVIKVN